MMRKKPIKSSSTLKSFSTLKSSSTLKNKKALSNKKPLSKGSSSLSSNTTLKSHSSLNASTPLKTKSTLKNSSTLSSKSTLKTRSTLETKTTLKTNSTIKAKQVGAKKTSSAYFSIFTGSDVSLCAITNKPSKKGAHVDVHHIFAGPYKAASEKRGFIIPLRHDYHVGTNYAIHEDRDFSESIKNICAKYYVKNEMGTKEDFIKEFGRWPNDVSHPLADTIIKNSEKRTNPR